MYILAMSFAVATADSPKKDPVPASFSAGVLHYPKDGDANVPLDVVPIVGLSGDGPIVLSAYLEDTATAVAFSEIDDDVGLELWFASDLEANTAYVLEAQGTEGGPAVLRFTTGTRVAEPLPTFSLSLLVRQEQCLIDEAVGVDSVVWSAQPAVHADGDTTEVLVGLRAANGFIDWHPPSAPLPTVQADWTYMDGLGQPNTAPYPTEVCARALLRSVNGDRSDVVETCAVVPEPDLSNCDTWNSEGPDDGSVGNSGCSTAPVGAGGPMGLLLLTLVYRRRSRSHRAARTRAQV